MKFADRENELERLESLYNSSDPKIAIIYGRRRIGKTALVTKSLDKRENSLYYQAIQTTAQDQIENFKETVAESFPEVERIETDWESILGYLIEQDVVIVLDEFPYLIETDKSIPSKIQRLWDHKAKESSAKLVLTGSAIGMMYDVAIEGGSPLYGRVSQDPNGEFLVEQLPFSAAMEFFKNYNDEEKVLAYGIFGGTPQYLRAIDSSQSLAENVTRTLLSQTGGLHNEPETVLRMELDEVNRYFALLRAIAEGNRERNELVQSSRIPQGSEGYYLDRLEKLHIIQKDYPVTEDPARSRSTRYSIRDQLFRFWFRFIYGQSTRYDLYSGDAFKDLVKPELPDFISETFERLCAEATLELYPEFDFVKPPERWWRKEREIDIVGLTDSSILAGEAKFTSQPVGYKTLSRLEEDVTHIDWKPGNETSFVLFSKSGFKKSVEEAAEERNDIRLYELQDVIEALR